MVRGEQIKPNEDRRLTEISPVRGAPWVLFVPRLAAGVLVGVVGEAVEVAAASVVEVVVALEVEVAGAMVVIWVLFVMRPWLLVSPIGGARMRQFWER